MRPESYTTKELINLVQLDPKATPTERSLARRLEEALQSRNSSLLRPVQGLAGTYETPTL